MTPLTIQEFDNAFSQPRKGTAADTRGFNAEMIKYSTRIVKEHVQRVANKVTRTSEELPPNWLDTTVKVSRKGENPSSPSNCRPICSIPILYKLFSQFFLKLLQPIRDASQSVDPAGFRPGHSTTEHFYYEAYIHTYRCSQCFTTDNERQCTLMPNANMSTSSCELSRETRSARSC